MGHYCHRQYSPGMVLYIEVSFSMLAPSVSSASDLKMTASKSSNTSAPFHCIVRFVTSLCYVVWYLFFINLKECARYNMPRRVVFLAGHMPCPGSVMEAVVLS